MTLPRSIFVACPCRDGIQPETVHMLCGLPMLFHETGIVSRLQIDRGGSFLPHVRNKLAADYIASDMDAVLMVDDDVSAPIDVIAKMILADVDYVAVAFARRENEPGKPVVPAIEPEFFSPPRRRRGGLIEVKRAGVALALVRRAVFDSILNFPRMGWPPNFFDSIDGESEDLSFSRRWHTAREAQYLLVDAQTSHRGVRFNLADYLASKVDSEP